MWVYTSVYAYNNANYHKFILCKIIMMLKNGISDSICVWQICFIESKAFFSYVSYMWMMWYDKRQYEKQSDINCKASLCLTNVFVQFSLHISTFSSAKSKKNNTNKYVIEFNIALDFTFFSKFVLLFYYVSLSHKYDRNAILFRFHKNANIISFCGTW